MAIQPASTPPITLSRYLTENQQEIATRESSKATMYKVAAVISAIAAIAISAGLSAVFLGLLGETSLSGWAMVGAITAFIGTMITSNTFFSWAKDSSATSDTYQKYANKFKEIKGWNETQIRAFFEANNIDMSKYTSKYLQLLTAKEHIAPCKLLLPLIARYEVAIVQGNEEAKTAERQIPGMNSPASNQGLRQMHRDIYNRAIDLKTYRNLEAALYLHALMEPSFAPPPVDSRLFEVIIKSERTPASAAAAVSEARRYKELKEFAMNHEPRDIRPLLFA